MDLLQIVFILLIVLIEPQWNVNVGITIMGTMIGVVLIEPQWNVNVIKLESSWKDYDVLIEPQWNVNCVVVSNEMNNTYSTNRTIVECKLYQQEPIQVTGTIVLIEPQWNVNEEGRILYVTPEMVLIEPQWNVNVEEVVTDEVTETGTNRTIVECK